MFNVFSTSSEMGYLCQESHKQNYFLNNYIYNCITMLKHRRNPRLISLRSSLHHEE